MSPARAQGRQGDDIERQPVEEVLAETPGGGGGRQIDVRGRHHAHRRRQRLAAPKPLELAVLDDTQDLFLDSEAGVSDLIEEQRAAVGEFKTSEPAFRRPGEGTGLHSEQLGLDQRLRQGGAVELDDRRGPAAGQKVHARGRQLLAGSALADDQYGTIERGDPRDMVEVSQEGG